MPKTLFSVDIAFIAGGKPAIVAVCRMISRSSSAVRPAFSEARRCWGICEERPVATSAATAAISRSRSVSPGLRVHVAVGELHDRASEVPEALDRGERLLVVDLEEPLSAPLVPVVRHRPPSFPRPLEPPVRGHGGLRAPG